MGEVGFFEVDSDFGEGLVLDLADAFFGDADDLPDLFEGERLCFGHRGLDAESVFDHFAFDL